MSAAYEVVWAGGPLLPDYPWASALAVPSERHRSGRMGVVWKNDDVPPAMLATGAMRVYCACGCGERIFTKDHRRVKSARPRFLRGHHVKIRAAQLRRAAIRNPTPWRGRFFTKGA